jgi:polysaccharide pyruvyl transferase WcaK-like protein
MENNKQTIVITGGNFVNKGAQSMLFCLVDHLSTKYPDHEIVLLDLFPSLSSDQKQNYQFTVLNMHVRTIARLSFPLLKLLFKKSPKSDNESTILKKLERATIVYDISGYGVSSHNQAIMWTFATLLPFRLAAKYNVPVQLLSQSLGPFEFKGWKRWMVWPFVKKWMRYPERIFIREPIARQYLKLIRTDNLVDSFDIVLQADRINPSHIFKTVPASINTKLAPNSVVVIPNRQLFRLWGEQNTVSFFVEIINQLINNNKKAVILRHSSDDKALCQAIYDNFGAKEKVELFNDDFYPHQMDQIIEQADALVSSRYHGLVHGLKNCIPVFSIGWAVKYNHLMQSFNLGAFHIGHDLENPAAVIAPKFAEFFAQLPQLKETIGIKMQEVTAHSIYKTYL